MQETASIVKFIPILILLFASCAVYFNGLFGDFVYDDTSQIVDNPWIKDISNIPTIFSKGVWSFQPGIVVSNYYRPLMHTVYMLNYYLFGLRPWGFHLVNIFFHCGVSILVFLVVRMLLIDNRDPVRRASPSPPFIAALLFTLHPIHTEAVTWIAGLPDVAFTFFYLLSFYLYVRSKSLLSGRYLFSVVCFAAAAFFKEPALTLPVILFSYDVAFGQAKTHPLYYLKRYVAYVIIGAVYIALRIHALGGFAPQKRYEMLSSCQFAINVFPLFVTYLGKLLLPLNLNAFYVFHPISSIIEWKGALSFLATIVFLILFSMASRRSRTAFLGLVFVTVPLIPVLYIPALGENTFTERYLYLPSAGFVLLLAVLISWSREKLPGAARALAFTLIIVAGLYAVETINRNIVWKNTFNLWSDTVRKSPDSAMAHNNLGIAYFSKGLYDMATEQYLTALTLKPDYAEAHHNLGNIYLSKGLYDMAIERYRTALRLKPGYAEPYYGLGLADLNKGFYDMAIEQFQTALRLKPDYVEVLNDLGNAYQFKGLYDMAIEQFRTAVTLKPDYAEAHSNLGNAYLSKGLYDMAIEQFQTALRLRPDLVQAHNNLGVAYQSKGLYDMAMEQYLNAVNLKPDYAEAHYNLGRIYLSKGSINKARAEFEVALSIKPDDYRTLQVLSSISSK